MDTMRLIEYTGYFHDGSVLDIRHIGTNIEFDLSSAEIPPNDIKAMAANFTLASDGTVRGKLCFNGVTEIRVNGRPIHDKLKMLHDDAELLDFEIEQGKIELGILWTDWISKPRKEEFWTVEIQADSITWITIPDLKSPTM